MDMPRTTRALLQAALDLVSPARHGAGICHDAADPGSAGACLDVAGAGGAVALALGCSYLHDHLTACRAAAAAGVMDVHHADRLPPGPFRFIFLDAAGLDPALTREFAAQAAERLEPGGMLVTSARHIDVAPWFGQLSMQSGVLLACQPRAGGWVPQRYTYDVTMGGQTLTLQSEPGVFSPRGLDPGTAQLLLALAEHIAERRAGLDERGAVLRFLDLGCGAGVVSLVASAVWGCQVTAVDVSARALRLTRQNAPSAEVLASDGFSALQGRTFDLVASNPPYHTDFAVARRFIEDAHRHLAPGGWLYLVVRRADWYLAKTRAVFGGCRVAEREGYVLIAAEKRADRRAPARPARPTTRKHARRVAASARRKRR